MAGPAESKFESGADVQGAGVLCAIPALLANGLLHEFDTHLPASAGYYEVRLLLMLFAFLALARVKSLEQVRYLPPGEWGRFLGLDRIPEVKTLRGRLDQFTASGNIGAWGEELSSFWMQLDEDVAGILYVDGHVRHYTGAQTQMPRRFSSRNRLCVPSLMDYWVNDERGVPFFVVSTIGNEGMLHHMRTTIIPRLLCEVPGQPTTDDLAADPDLHRFVMVFDREGWSPEFFAELWREHRIAVQTYQRGTKDMWSTDAFKSYEVPVVFGNTKTMQLGERPFVHKALSATTDAPEVAAREIRRSCAENGHQTSIITTLRIGNIANIAGHMFARWSQENFFKYAARELAIDRLAGYILGETPEGETIKNPAYVQLDAKLRRNQASTSKLTAQRGRLRLESDAPSDIAAYTAACAPIDNELEALANSRDELLAARRAIPKRIPLTELPEDQRPRPIAPARTQFLNLIRIIAYRAETAMAMQLREHLRADETRALLKDLFTHDADLEVNQSSGTLTVRVHHFTNPRASRAIDELLLKLNETMTIFPGTELRLCFELVSKVIPTSQEL